jgi:hypothetical protein
MALTTFTAAQVLTAAQLNAVQANDYNQTVSTKTASYTLVAADKGTRVVMNVASANTVTVNTSLFSAGDTLVIQNIGAGITTVTAGTATVSSAGPLAIPQNGSGLLYFTSAGVSIFYPSAVTAAAPAASGLTFISGGSVGTGTSFSLPTDSFTATYQNYLIVWSQVGKTAGVDLNMRLRAAGTDTTSGDYNFGAFTTDTSGTYGAVGSGASSTFWAWGECNNTNLGTTSGFTYIYSPQVASLTAYTTQSYTSGLSKYSAGRINLSTQFDALTIFSSGVSTFNTGNYKLYGLADS